MFGDKRTIKDKRVVVVPDIIPNNCAGCIFSRNPYPCGLSIGFDCETNIESVIAIADTEEAKKKYIAEKTRYRITKGE